MSELYISAVATVDALTAKKEGPGNDKVLALHVKMRGPVTTEVLTNILGASFEHEVGEAFWRQDRDNVYFPRFVNVESVSVPSETIFPDCTAKFGKWKVGACRVHKFSFEPTEGRMAYLTFTVSISHPEPGVLPYLAELLGESVPVTVYEDQQALPFEQGEPETEEAEAES